jgi:CRP-like cAMP-binding protein
MPSFIQTITQLEALTADELAVLERFCLSAKMFHLKKGEDLFNIFPAREIMVHVDSGMLKQYVTDDNGNEKITHLFAEGCVFENCSGQEATPGLEFSVKAVEDSQLTLFLMKDIIEVSNEYPVFLRVGGAITAQHVRDHNEHMALLMKYSPEDRYRYILERRPELLQRLSVTNLAQYLDISRETLSRIRSKILEESVS